MSEGGKIRDNDPFTNAVDKVIGLRLRRIRESLGLTRAQVAQALGISDQRWGDHEDGKRISASRLWKFCVRFDLHVHDILADLPKGMSSAVEPASGLARPAGVAEAGGSFDWQEDATADALARDMAEVAEAMAAMTPIERGVALAALKGIAGRRTGRRKRAFDAG